MPTTRQRRSADIGTLYQDETAPLYKGRAIRLTPGATIPARVLWGDTHLHTANSLDAAAFGDTLGPETAYRFARGEEVVSSSGQPVGSAVRSTSW